MRILGYLALRYLALLFVSIAPAFAQEAAPVVTMSPAEQAFAEAMSESVMVGSFTLFGEQEPKLRDERYELGAVTKVAEGQWQFQTRIRYGDKDVQLPITLPVQWAGDTAVIIVDNVGFPGLGIYSARVLIHDGKYAGHWGGADHGGHLFGVVESRQKAEGRGQKAEGSKVVSR